ncbi:hypothetical protein GF420_11335 [candidate division GN15 bacterium]|nr:hypothetical protein [candidate division GN15 bacterium]
MIMHRLKQCPGCGEWFTWQQLIDDPNVRPLGMNVEVNDHRHGYLHFHHTTPGCNTAFVISTRDIIPRIIRAEADGHRGHSENCPGYCTSIDELRHCHTNCSFASVRSLLLEIVGKSDDEPEVVGHVVDIL